MSFPRDVVIDPAPPLTSTGDGPGFFRIWTSLGTDSHPPLYFMALHAWRRAFGDGDVAARYLSVAFSLIAIALLYDVARLLHGRAVGLWAALLMALAGPQIQYAQEARNYTMLLALTLAACDALVRIEKRGPSRWRAAALGASLLAMMLTHYLAFPAAAALLTYALVRLRGPALRWAMTSFAVAGVAFAVAWGPFLLEQRRGIPGELAAAREAADGNFTRGLKRLAILPLRYFTEPMKNSLAIGQVAAVIYVLPLLLLWRRRDLLLWCLLGGLTIGAVFASDVLRSAHGLAYVRYTLVASAPAYALAAAMLWHMTGVIRHVVPLVLAVACVLALEEPYSIAKADTRELAQFIRARCDPADVLVIHTLGEQDWQAHAMYLGLAHYAPPPCPIVFLDSKPSPDVARRIRAARHIWMMSPSPAIPNEDVFSGSVMAEASFFPWVGTVERVKW
jgi:4-amino-4-deoxy-L-arabinose transferase-like glycosyltransferase